MTSHAMYQYHTDSFDEMIRITVALLHRSIGFRCWFELEGDCWIIELTGAF